MRDKPIRKEIYKNHVIEIYPDESSESPREWDNVGTMVCFHRRYNLGDKHGFGSPDDFQEYIEEHKKDIVSILPIYMYDHGGISISTSRTGCFADRWDSGQVGYIYVLEEKARKEFDWNEEHLEDEHIKKIEDMLVQEVKTYNQFLMGEVYGYVIHGAYDEGDSVWGYYGIDDVISDAKSSIDSAIEYREKELAELNEIGLEGYIVLPPYPFNDEEVEE